MRPLPAAPEMLACRKTTPSRSLLHSYPLAAQLPCHPAGRSFQPPLRASDIDSRPERALAEARCAPGGLLCAAAQGCRARSRGAATIGLWQVAGWLQRR